jgi:hypothetical protein
MAMTVTWMRAALAAAMWLGGRAPAAPAAPVRRLTAEEIAAAKAGMAKSPQWRDGVVAEQSFDIGGGTRILAFFAPDGGKNKTGEVGILVVRDGHAPAAPDPITTMAGSRILGVEALSFFDANGDGLRDVLMLYRMSSTTRKEPTPVERTWFTFFVANRKGAFEEDMQLGDKVNAATSTTGPIKTVADAKRAWRLATKAPARDEGPPPTPTHAFDGTQCRGKAELEDADDDAAPAGGRCIGWTFVGVKCKRARGGDTDWILDQDGKICLREGTWSFTGDPPGQGSCEVSVASGTKLSDKTRAQDASFSIDCNWKSMGSGPRVDGADVFQFTPLAKVPAAPPK